jgi:hypothetical protein
LRWIAATAAIVAVCAAGVVWIYLRDWERPHAHAAEKALALIDAKRMVAGVGAARRCLECRIEVLDTRGGVRRWRVRVTGSAATRCFWIDLDSFSERPNGRYHGVRRARCGWSRRKGVAAATSIGTQDGA